MSFWRTPQGVGVLLIVLAWFGNAMLSAYEVAKQRHVSVK